MFLTKNYGEKQMIPKESKMFMRFLLAVLLSFMPGVINLFWLPNGMVSEWYINLAKFPFTPNIYIFGILWSVIHLVLGAGLYLLIKSREEKEHINKALGLFLTNIVLSAIWPFLLFKYHLITISMLDSLLILIIACVMQKFFARENKYAGYIAWLYIVWLMFALYMHIGIFILN